MLKSRFQKMKDVYHGYPRFFWILTGIILIDGALFFPFFPLYLTSIFGVGIMDHGVLLAAGHIGIISIIGFFVLHHTIKQAVMPVTKLQESI